MVCGHKWREIANPSLVAAAFGFFSSPYATTQPSSTSLGLLAAGKFLVVRLSLHNSYNSQGGCMSRDLLLVTSDADLSSAARSSSKWSLIIPRVTVVANGSLRRSDYLLDWQLSILADFK